jgi:4-alpha-glucanotransferase
MKQFPVTKRRADGRGGLDRWNSRADSRESAQPRSRIRHQGRGGAGRLVRDLATRLGIQTSYVDMAGQEREAPPETLEALVELWGCSAGNPAEAKHALRELDLRTWRRMVEPVVVAWSGKTPRVDLRLPGDLDPRRVHCRLLLEDGDRREIDPGRNLSRALEKTEIDGRAYVVRRLSIPSPPPGYHWLELEARGRLHRSLVISAPEKSYSPPGGERIWGAFLPMYAARSRESWGAGGLGEWQKLSDWVASLGGTVVSTLPLLAAFLDQPVCEPSPYSPASRLFWNEFYLDIAAVPEFSNSKAAQKAFRSPLIQKRIRDFQKSPLVDYRGEMEVRRKVLEAMAKSFFSGSSSRRDEFERFLGERPVLADYAEFRATGDARQASWHTWDQRMRYGRLEPGDYAEENKRYHCYVQWLMQRQISSLMEQCRARQVQFYLDLPLGVHPDGYDIWRQRDMFAFPASAGAPPDMFFTKGQNWGFAPLHPQRLRERGYQYLLDYLRFQMRHTGMLRVDHVMGLHRLYWVPQGFPATAGAYVTYPAGEMHAIFSLESHRHQTVLVGENLGTVPPAVNEAMERHGWRQMYVVQYEQQPNSRRPLRPPPRASVASINTHDMPTFAAHWQGSDLEDRVDLGLIPRGKLSSERERRRRLNSALAAFLRREGWLKEGGGAEPLPAVLRACLEWLASSPAEILQINLEDLWQETRPQNVPGTSTERPVWRGKACLELESIVNCPDLREFLTRLTSLRRRAARRR